MEEENLIYFLNLLIIEKLTKFIIIQVIISNTSIESDQEEGKQFPAIPPHISCV